METMKLKFTPIPAEPMFTILINGKKCVFPDEGEYELFEEIGKLLLKAAPHLFTVQGSEEIVSELIEELPLEEPEAKPPEQVIQKVPALPVKRAYNKKKKRKG